MLLTPPVAAPKPFLNVFRGIEECHCGMQALYAAYDYAADRDQTLSLTLLKVLSPGDDI